MNKWIVLTTINPPTKAIGKISAMTVRGWRCVVVGDNKTPADWSAEGVDYLSIAQQHELYGELSSEIPANHYCRKNLGYLYAIEKGAEVILETDDDNIPLEEFGARIDRCVEGDLVGGSRWVNVYRHFTDRLIWPRGNPLDTIHQAGALLGQEAETRHDCPVQQFLADGDPDVDAIYRLLFKEPLYFNKRAPVVLDKGSWCAFNSQNTLFFKDAFPLLYLPCHVSFRMTDIWRSFVAQAALWQQGKRLAFLPATVVQERNEHNLMRDFRDEVDGYLRNDEIALALAQLTPTSSVEFVLSAWEALHAIGVAKDVEIHLVRSWMARCAEAIK